jgi:3-oxoacyl-[acyl-carrier protein] reductase
MTTVVLTGAAGGIGRATVARLLARTNAHVVATDADADALHRAFPEPSPRLALRPLDVTDPNAWTELFRAHPAADALVQLAGVLEVGAFVDQPPEVWERMLRVNLLGVLHGTWAAARHFLARGGGRIVAVASLAGVAPIPNLAAYTASKFGVRGFVRALDLELRPRGVPCTVVCPGPVWTPMVWRQMPKDEAAFLWAGGGPLPPAAVARALERALRRAPPEILLPRGAGWLARLAGAFPAVTRRLAPVLERRARARHRRLQRRSHATS